MELDLKNFSSTLAVGVFVVGIAFLGLHLFWKSYQAPLFAAISKWGTMGQALTGLFLVLIVFGCGIVGETFSNRFVDADYGEWLYERILPTEKTMRADTLFGDGEDVPRLAIELARTGRLSRFARGEEEKAFAELVEKYLIDHPGCTRTSLESALNSNPGVTECTKKLQGLASSLYYTAKNVLTGHDNIAQELWTIQRRLDFCRSIATYSALFAILGFAASLAHLILKFIFPKRSFAIPWPPKLLFCFGLSLLFVITRYCYSSEEREFNIRTYGYFATLSEADLPEFSTKPAPPPGDFSGAVKLANGHILFVHDAKAGTTLTRVGTVNPQDGSVVKVEVHWPAGEAIASDLEAVCLLQGTHDILLSESGYYQDPKKHSEPQFGRIFRCEPQFAAGNYGRLLSLKVTGVWHWPKRLPGDMLTQDIEGVVCIKAGDQHIIVAAERGGRIFQASATLNSSAQQLVFSNNGQPLLDLRNDPRFAFLQEYDRKISDLTITSTGELWASAAFEPGKDSDLGPFKSTAYKLGQITTDPNAIITFAPHAGKVRVDGFKVEALSEIEPGKMFIGTDDERLGGTWRVIKP